MTEHIFLLADSPEEAKAIDQLNGCGNARVIKDKRMGKLAREGEVNEMDMPDTNNDFFKAMGKRRLELQALKLAKLQEGGEAIIKDLSVELDNVEIILKDRVGHIKVNGQELRGVKSFKLECEACELPKLTLEFIATKPPRGSL